MFGSFDTHTTHARKFQEVHACFAWVVGVSAVCPVASHEGSDLVRFGESMGGDEESVFYVGCGHTDLYAHFIHFPNKTVVFFYSSSREWWRIPVPQSCGKDRGGTEEQTDGRMVCWDGDNGAIPFILSFFMRVSEIEPNRIMQEHEVRYHTSDG